MKNALNLDLAAANKILRLALEEDLGKGDVTSQALPEKSAGTAEIIARESGIICGLPLIAAVYRLVDKRIKVKVTSQEGRPVKAGSVVAKITGPLQPILTGERTALNFLSALSGMATVTRSYVDAVKGTRAKIVDTRKTPPGLRSLAKYAVRAGGGHNHRMGLWDMVLIKDNHIAGIGITEAVKRAKQKYPNLKVEVEVEKREQLKEALATKADIVMLDNMTLPRIRKALAIAKKRKTRPIFEVSGGVALKNVREIARTGVDRIAIGRLTHSFKNLDVSMEIAGR